MDHWNWCCETEAIGENMKEILVVDFHGLWFKGGMDSYIRPAIEAIPGVHMLTDEASSWSNVEDVRDMVDSTRSLYAGVVAYGHSMGAGAASRLTDDGKVDLVFAIDAAGQAMSPFGKNTGRVFDFHDTAFAMVPKFRVNMVRGYEDRRVYQQRRMGHMGITYSQPMVDYMVREIRALAQARGAA